MKRRAVGLLIFIIFFVSVSPLFYDETCAAKQTAVEAGLDYADEDAADQDAVIPGFVDETGVTSDRAILTAGAPAGRADGTGRMKSLFSGKSRSLYMAYCLPDVVHAEQGNCLFIILLIILSFVGYFACQIHIIHQMDGKKRARLS